MSELNDGLADSISMLEQILEVMPQDIDALKALYNANLQSGNPARSFEYLNRIIDVAANLGDPDLFEYLQNELPRFEETHSAEVAAHQVRIRTLFGVHKINKKVLEPAKAPSEKPDPSSEVDISEELALAWRLYQENQISQDEYSSVLHDLTEVSSKELDVPVSVLHVLNDRGFSNLTRIMAFVANRSGLPYISLFNFELDERAANALPPSYSMHEGLLPFGYLGNDLLVAVLNPFNTDLIEKAEKESGHRCHVFLVEPDDYDAALAKLRALVSKAA
ncbi:hypothetical protein P4C99_17500 [Pontiellaceae bacterium B1224]|nr:hypothetical protein [Pontiellaceae bacterium B1224]